MSENAVTPLGAALEVIAKTTQVSDPYEIAKANALIRGYNGRYIGRFSSARIISTEFEFRFPLVNPETAGRSQSFDEAGKIDGILEENGTLKLIEHKTTVDSVEPDSDYWTKLSIDSQISKYILGAHHAGHKVESVIYDVIKKPASRPCMIPTLDENGLKIVTDRDGNRVFLKNGEPRQSADTEKGFTLKASIETPAQYEARLTADIAERPDFYFGQKETTRLDSQALEYMEDAWAQSQQILYYRRRNLWPRNPNACTLFGTCEFFNLCAGRASIDGIDYRAKAARHEELSVALQAEESADRQLLTNSRVTSMRSCARKHFLSYEQPTERVAEEKTALRFGTLFHQGLEAWLNTIKAQQSQPVSTS